MDVGVRELKQRLSEYLERVGNGETIRVTDRGVPKALITPLRSTGRLQQGIDEGWIRPAKRAGLQPMQPAVASRSIAEVLAQDRDE